MERNHKCDCINCRPHPVKELGAASTRIMIGGVDSPPVVAATISIECVPLLVENWMLQDVLILASKRLTSLIVKNYSEKVEN